MVTLVPMTPEEKKRQFERSQQSYTADVASAEGLDAEEAARQVQAQVERLLPEGLETPGHCFMWMVAGDQERVGWTWVGPHGGDYYIYDIEIDAAFRGGGLGGSAIDQIEALVRDAGATKLGLHVFEVNTTARRLYERSGFVVTETEPGHIHMWKDLARV